MAVLKSDKSMHKSKELAELRGLRYSALRRTLIVGGAGFLLLIIAAVLIVLFSSGGIVESKQQLSSISADWSQSLVTQYEESRAWLGRHGIRTEASIFDNLSNIIFSAILAFDIDQSDPSFFSKLAIGLGAGVLRAGFIIIASLRLWILAILAAFTWHFVSKKVYVKDDLLGQTGNGRHFYSGIRADLYGIVEQGGPATYVRGLACPKSKSAVEAKVSNLGKILEHFGAVNDTNLMLAAIILAHEEVPAYVAPHGEDAELSEAFSGNNLIENTELILTNLLELHASYKAGSLGDLNPDTSLAAVGVNSSDYSELLKIGCDRVLTPGFKQELVETPVEEVATVLLANEAGKVLAYAYDSGRWLRKSNYPELCARAVLNSVVEFSKDYEFHTRQVLRRSLVYGSRRTAFGPVSFPVDLSQKCRALRQWVELLMACPHELSVTTDEVELFGIVSELRQGWDREFLNCVENGDPEVTEHTYSTMTGLFFMPLPNVVNIIRRFTPQEQLERLSTLVAITSRRQLDFIEAEEAKSTDGDAVILPSYERIFSPLTDDEVNTLVEFHELDPTDIRDWSTFRVVLNMFGWLARRVGDYSVPESSIIYAVLKSAEGGEDFNQLGFMGLKGRIGFRSSRLMEHFGLTWNTNFKQVDTATMAETPEDFNKRMNGIEDDVEFQDVAVG